MQWVKTSFRNFLGCRAGKIREIREGEKSYQIGGPHGSAHGRSHRDRFTVNGSVGCGLSEINAAIIPDPSDII